jgi:citrate synthase
VTLAQTCTFEQVAELLWLGTLPERGQTEAGWADAASSAAEISQWLIQFAAAAPVERMLALLAAAGARDAAAFDLRAASVAVTARRILRMSLAAAIFPTRPTGRRLAEELQLAWAPQQPESLPVIEAALILCADHELNDSAFTARCVASAGGTPYGVVVAALSALQGGRHGGALSRAAACLDEIGSPARAADILGARMRRGEVIPGFGHALYPEGDPRSRALLAMAETARPRAKALRLANALTVEAARLIGEQPTLDLALAVIEQAFEMPRGAGLALFALGRSAGWIAHALEQYATSELIRPRATYVGVLPGADGPATT